MDTSSLYLQQLRRRAGAHLPPDFARRVIDDARRRRRARVQVRLYAITGAACVLTAVSVHLFDNRIAEQKSLQLWAKTAAQIEVLEESI